MTANAKSIEPAAPAVLPESAAAESAPAPVHPVRRARRAVAHPRFRPYFLTVAGVAVAVWLGHYAVHAYRYETTDNAYVVGHLHQISPQISGQVKEVRVQDNQNVKAGDVLVVLDPSEFEIARQKAAASVAQAQAQESQAAAATAQAAAQAAETGARVNQAEAQVAQARTQLDLAKITLARYEQLFRQDGGATQAEVDNARTAFNAAQAALDAAGANRTAAQAAMESSAAAQKSAAAQTVAARASVAVATAALHDAERQLAYTVITAPADGRIGNKNVEAGNRVAAGQTLLALAENDPWVVANFKETQLARMHPGEDVEINVDALPGQVLHGRIDSLSPASGAQFALLPPDNATGNFNKVVQRIPVKIILSPESLRRPGERLRLGYSVIVDVRVR